MQPKSILLVLLSMLGNLFYWPQTTLALTASSLLTPREQGALIQAAGGLGRTTPAVSSVPGGAQTKFLADLESVIRRANPGSDAQWLRQPVSETAIRKLQARSAIRGKFISAHELRAMTDYAHALMAESRSTPLADKVRKLPNQLRKPFHGNVAEVAEARSRGMTLTKSRQSPMWDLTEKKFSPRNYQMKIYAQHGRALTSLLDDLDRKRGFTRHGITTRDTLERGVKSGRLVRRGNVYSPVGRPDIKLHASKVFSRPADSALYAKAGRKGLIKHGLVAQPKNAATPSQTAGKWAGRAGILVAAGTEVYLFNRYLTGRMSEGDFVSAQAGIGGGIAGGVVGGKAGAALGAAIGVWFGGAGAIPGAIIGGIIGGVAGGGAGAYLSASAAQNVYAHLDERQKQEIAKTVYRYYGVTY